MPADKPTSRRNTKRAPRARGGTSKGEPPPILEVEAIPVVPEGGSPIGGSPDGPGAWAFEEAERVARIGQELRRSTSGTGEGEGEAPIDDEAFTFDPTATPRKPLITPFDPSGVVTPTADRFGGGPTPTVPPADTKLVETPPAGLSAEVLRSHQADLVQRELALVQREQKVIGREREVAEGDKRQAQRELGLVAREKELTDRIASTEQRLNEAEERIAAIQSRESQLNQAAQALEAGQSALSGKSSELDQFRSRLDERQGGLDKQEKTIGERATSLARGEAGVRQRMAELVQQRGLVEQERQQQLQLLEQERARAAAEVDAKMREAQEFRQELVRRLNAARAKLRKRESAADERDEQQSKQSVDLDARQESVYRQREVAERRRIELDEQQGKLDHARTQAEHARTLLDQEHARSEQESARLVALEAELKQKLEKTARRQRELDDTLAQARKRGTELDRRQEDLEKRRKSAVDDRALMDQEAERLSQREREIEQQRKATAAREQSFSVREAELQKSREQLETTIQETVEIENLARKKLEDAEAFSLQLAAREADLSQASLQLTIDREALGQQQGEVTSRRDVVAHLHAEAQRVLRESRSSVVHERTASAAPLIGLPRRSALARTAIAATTLAVTAAALTWWLNPRQAVSTLALKVLTQRDESRVVANEYARLMSEAAPGSLTLAGSPMYPLWSELRETGRLDVTASADGGSVELTLRGGDEQANARSLNDLGSLMTDAPRLLAGRLQIAPRHAAWKQGRDALASQAATAKARMDEHRSKLRQSEGFERWSQARSGFESIQEELVKVGERLAAQRGLWTATRDQPAPISEPPPDALDQALATDTAFQEDMRELDLSSRDYRLEVNAVMGRVEPLLLTLQSSTKQWLAALDQQRAAEPPARLLPMLEHSAQAASGYEGRIEEFLGIWRAQRDQASTPRAASASDPILRDESRVAQEAKRVVSGGKAISEEFESRLRQVTEGGDASPRDQVVAGAVRGAIAPLRQALLELTRAVRPLDATENFRLDALDRQLRGLRTRLADRREWLRRDLARRHAETTRMEHEQGLRNLESNVHGLERERDELTAALGQKLAEMKALEGQVESLRQAAAELRASEALSGDLERRLAEHDAAQPVIAGDALSVGTVESRVVGGEHRASRSALVGLGVFIAAWLPALLLLAARPSRRSEIGGARPAAARAGA